MRAAALSGLVLVCGCGISLPDSDDSAATAPDVLTNQWDWVGGAGKDTSIDLPGMTSGSLLLLSIMHDGPYVDLAGWVELQGVPFEVWGISEVSCGRFVETWLLRGTPPPSGDAQIHVTMDAVEGIAGVVLEFSRSDYNALESVDTPESTGTPEAPQLKAGTGDVVISAIASCGDLEGDAVKGPFVASSKAPGCAVAYAIPDASGKYGASWNTDLANWASHTTVLK